MPLILHHSSTCDVCQDPFTWDEQEKSPHAIPCGHVFCRGCLLLMYPNNCPLCRKPYLCERIKKLHVDRYETADDGSAPAFKLLQRIAMASAESATIEDMNSAANEAQEWLSSQHTENSSGSPLSLSHQMAVRYAVEGLHRVRIVQGESQKATKRLKEDISRLERENSELQQDKLHLQNMEKFMIDATNDKEEKFKLQVNILIWPVDLILIIQLFTDGQI
ncbi:hypothetical protein QCA50_005438 [Cerrena zonata]|uniref:RING-type domain-containing protein n=1 Tax=Cerrena zonata TaxID=2478898 RepID=A0AAW0GEZ5_9APHY